MNNSYFPSPRTVVFGLLAAITLAAYWPVQNYPFTNYDDPEYVIDNPHVTTGLTLKNIEWAFTKSHSANWHPLTWISHMIDCQVYGLVAGGHHTTNLIIHILNAMLLFSLLSRMTGAHWRSALVAALFALHPLHVESVAWVAERKDVLCTFFLFLTIGAYVRYAQRPGLGNYTMVVVLFAAGLMAKPMLVTLPVLLLILDFWPLYRLCYRPDAGFSSFSPTLSVIERSFTHLVFEKIPLFALSLGSCIVTVIVQKNYRATSEMPLDDKLSNAFISYVSYIVSFVFPKDLCVLYPYQEGFSYIISIGAVCFIGIITLFIVRKRKYKWLLAGWLWYVCSLVPVIGIIQVGMQQRADRYTYIPLIGLFIILSWGMNLLLSAFPKIKTIGITFTCAAIVCLAILTREQVTYWKDNVTLYSHALQCNEKNYVIHNNLGSDLLNRGQVEIAQKHFEACLRIPVRTYYSSAEYNLGRVYSQKGDFDRAIEYFKEAIRSDSTNFSPYFLLGEIYKKTGKDSSSIACFKKAIHFKPDFLGAYLYLGFIMLEKDSLKTAIDLFSGVIEMKPDNWQARYFSGLSWAKKGDFQRAFIRFLEAIELCKGAATDPYISLGVLLYKKGKLSSAKGLFSQAIGIAPLHAELYCNRATVYWLQNNLDSAEADYVHALRLKPGLASAHKRLAQLYTKKGMIDLALFHRNKIAVNENNDDSLSDAQPIKLLPNAVEMKK
jgi:protein O-mannosyl-transferase